jgi:hypothetical protein
MDVNQIGTCPTAAFKWQKPLLTGLKIARFAQYMFHRLSERKKRQRQLSPLMEFQLLLTHD